MTKVYVVTRGQYSSCINIGVFSNKAEAERLKDIIGGNDVEEYELDPQIYQSDKPYFTVVMDRNGKVDLSRIHQIKREEAFDYEDLTIPLPMRWALDTNEPYRLEVWSYAYDEQHAIKIANEIRAQLLAAGIYDLLHPNGPYRFRNFITKYDVRDIFTLKLEEE